MTDDQDGSDILSTVPPRRIPLYVTIPIVLACGLIGYGLSLALPLYRAPAPAPAAAVAKPTEPAKGADAGPGRQDASFANAGSGASTPVHQTPAAAKPAAAAMAPPSKLGRGELPPVAPIAPVTKAATPAPAVETGSVEHAPQRATLPAGDKSAARPAEAPEAARAEPPGAEQQPVTKRADGSPRKRVRRVYRPRAQPKTAKGPFETLFPALAK